MKLGEWVDIWREKYDRPTVRQTSYAAHGYVLKNHILPLLGEVELKSISERTIAGFLAECKARGNKRRAEPLSDETMRHILTLLRMVLDKAVEDGHIAQNPALAFGIKRPKNAKAEPLTYDELERYLTAAEALGCLPIFLLALEHGLRQRELIALKWSDFDAEKRTLTIHKERTAERGKIVEREGEARTIVLSNQTADALVCEHEKHPSSAVVFIHPGTLKPYSPCMIRRLHSRALKCAGLPHVRFVDLRHTFAVQAMKAGKDLRKVAAEMGYTRAFTARKSYGAYLRQDNDNERAVAKRGDVRQEQGRVAEGLGEVLGV